VVYIVSIGTGTMPSLAHGPLSRVPVWSGLTRVKNATEILLEEAYEHRLGSSGYRKIM